MIQTNPALFAQAAKYPPDQGPGCACGVELVAAAGGGSKGLAILGTISANQAAITGVIAAAPQLATLTPYSAQLTALSAGASRRSSPAVQRQVSRRACRAE